MRLSVSNSFSRQYQPSAFQYEFLKQHELFDKALGYFLNDSAALETVIVYGLFEWKFWEVNPEKDSIIEKILSRKHPEQIKKLIHQAWEQRILSPEEIIFIWEKALPLFDTIPELKDHISILLWLFDRVPNLIKQVFELSSVVISKTTNGTEVYGFLRHLYKNRGIQP